jgi:hypothetical protein
MAMALLTLGQSLANPFDAQFGFALDRLLTCPTWIQFLILRDVGLAEGLLLPVHYLGDVLVKHQVPFRLFLPLESLINPHVLVLVFKRAILRRWARFTLDLLSRDCPIVLEADTRL